jgi:hypothetical protein
MDEAELPPPVPSLPPMSPPILSGADAIQAPPFGDASTVVPLAPAPVEPKKSKKGLMVGVGAMAVAAIGLVGFLVSRGSDAPTYSLQRAASQAGAAKTIAYEMTVKAGPAGEIKIIAASDNDRKLTKMNMDLGSLAAGGKMDAIVDGKSATMYMNAEFFAKLGAPTKDAKWIKIDLNDATGVDFKSILDQSGDPLATAKMFDNAKNVKDLGLDEVNGERVKHFEVTLDSAAVLKAQPGLQKQLDATGVTMPKTIVYNVYVNAANQFRRMQFEMDVAGQTVATDMVVTSVGEPVDIQLPSGDGVVDVKSLGG